MAEVFIYIVVFIFTLIGISEAVHILTAFVLRPDKSANKGIVISLDNDCAFEQLSQLLNEINWQGEKYANVVFALTDMLTEEMKTECKMRYKKSRVIFLDDVESIGESYVKFVEGRSGC